MTVLFTEAVEDAGDVLVVEPRQHVGLALEGVDRLALRVGVGEIVDHLGQCAAARGKAQVLGQVDQLHPAAAERLHDAVAAADYGVWRNHREGSR